jgi:outer membrane protein assembly factor BamB
MLVHGVAVDDASCERARRAINERKLWGQASVERLPLRPLPHLDNLASLVVIEDFDGLAQQGLAWEEVDRIVAPGGRVCLKKDGRWTATVKARPPEMDDWTHPAHGPDGNRVSQDRLARLPVGLRWLDGVPLNLGETYATARGWVVAGGRCFTLGPAVLENVAPAGFLKHQREEYLVARDAFNGLPLWQVNLETLCTGRMVSTYNFAPLATDGRCVYVYKKDRLVALAAESGQVVVEYPVRFPTERLLVVPSTLVSSEWESKEPAKDAGHGVDYAVHSVVKTAAGAIEAFDAATGKLKWSLAAPAQELVAADGVLFLLLQAGNPPAQQQILAVDLETGRGRWRVGPEQLSPDPAIHLNCAGAGVLVVAHMKAKRIAIRSAATGKVLWEINPAAPATSPGMLWTPLVDGLLWRGGKKYDPLTGEVRGLVPAGIEAKPCCPAALVGDRLLVDSRGSSFWDLQVSPNNPDRYRYVSYHAVRGACIAGTTPANGMFYTGQNYCTCVPGQVPGFVAFGPCGKVPGRTDLEAVRPVERGPAFGTVRTARPAQGEWPSYRHDPQRSGATRGNLPPQLTRVWQTDVARPEAGPLSSVWKARLTSWLSAPVVAEGRVFTAAVDLGRVAALDAATGKLAWQASIGARIDSPPAIHGGLCIFGAHDGWVYALSTADGRLAWRTRVAPWERRMVAFGQVESVWPAIGAVLVRDRWVYATAGRTSESDGGVAVCALDVFTGQSRWATGIGAGTFSLNEVLTMPDDKLAWRHVQIDTETGQLAGAGQRGPGGGLEGLHDGTWTRLGKRRSGNRHFGRATAEMFVWSDTMLFGYESLVGWNANNRWCFAVAKSKTAGTGTLSPQEYTWRLIMPRDAQVEALALAGNALLLAGRTCDPKSDAARGFLWRVSLEDGKQQAEYPLDAPPAYDGLAIAGEKVYLSLEDGRVICFGN